MTGKLGRRGRALGSPRSPPRKAGLRHSIKRGARGSGCSRLPPAMSSNSDATPDPEAPRPLAHRRHHGWVPLPWALSIALVLLAGAGAAYVIRTWVVPRGSASLGASPAPDSRLPDVPEFLPDARARLPDSTQVRCAPTWDPFSIPHPPGQPPLLHAGPTVRPFGPREHPSLFRLSGATLSHLVPLRDPIGTPHPQAGPFPHGGS